MKTILIMMLLIIGVGCKKKNPEPAPAPVIPVVNAPDSVLLKYSWHATFGLSNINLGSVYTSKTAISSTANATYVYPNSSNLTPNDSVRVAIKDSLYVRWTVTGKNERVMGKPLVAQFYSNGNKIYPNVTLTNISTHLNGDISAALIFSYKLK